jgi:hypothetical protein
MYVFARTMGDNRLRRPKKTIHFLEFYYLILIQHKKSVNCVAKMTIGILTFTQCV